MQRLFSSKLYYLMHPLIRYTWEDHSNDYFILSLILKTFTFNMQLSSFFCSDTVLIISLTNLNSFILTIERIMTIKSHIFKISSQFLVKLFFLRVISATFKKNYSRLHLNSVLFPRMSGTAQTLISQYYSM